MYWHVFGIVRVGDLRIGRGGRSVGEWKTLNYVRNGLYTYKPLRARRKRPARPARPDVEVW